MEYLMHVPHKNDKSFLKISNSNLIGWLYAMPQCTVSVSGEKVFDLTHYELHGFQSWKDIQHIFIWLFVYLVDICLLVANKCRGPYSSNTSRINFSVSCF